MGIDIRQRPEGALLRTYLTAAGVAPDSFHKPMIGVATASTQVFSEKPEARDLGTAAASGIEASGGIAMRWDTVRSPELMTWGHAESYSFAWRDQLADFIESWARQQALDGIVLVGDAPETLAGMAMAAARLNLPAILVTTGVKSWAVAEPANGLKKKTLQDPFELLNQMLFKNKKGAPEKVDTFKDCLLVPDNHASNALDLVFEALGICLPGMATAAAQSPKRHELAYASGQRIISLVKTNYGLRRVLTINAFTNAIRLNAALGGSVDVVVHLVALAHEAGLNLPLDLFDRVARETPHITHLGGVGEKEPHSIQDLERAGGVWAVMNTFKNHILPGTTVGGKGALELSKSALPKDAQVISTKKPYAKQSGIGILKGNLAPHGAVFLLNQIEPTLQVFRGSVVVFESELTAATAVSQGKIKKGMALVVRGQGPKGGPGLHKLRVLPALLETKGLNTVIPLLTDGRLPDKPKGFFVSLISPEGVAKGALAVLRTGDAIEIDVPSRQLMVRLTDTDMQVRLARWQAPQPKSARGFLDRYSRSVSDIHEGAVLK